MKKFTHLDEDLIKENLEAKRQFDIEYNFALVKLETIKSSLNNMVKEQSNNPGDYGYIGDIIHVAEYLDEILVFLIDYQPTFSAI
jgi:hypothetical protein